jgi:hypothetical protein
MEQRTIIVDGRISVLKVWQFNSATSTFLKEELQGKSIQRDGS